MEQPLSSFYTHALVLNIILNPGMLAIPAAFSHSGVVLSGIILMITGILSFKLSHMLLEIHYKSSHIKNSKDYGYGKLSITQLVKGEVIPIVANENQENECRIDTDNASNILLGKILSFAPIVIFNTCSLLLMCLCFSTFASTLAYYLPIGPVETCDIYSENEFFTRCRGVYLFFLCVFMVFTYHYISRSIENQMNIHFVTCAYRLLLIIIASLFCLKLTIYQRNISTGIFKMFMPPTIYNFTNIGEILSVSFTCFLIQPQLASIYHLTQRPKSFSSTLKYCMFLCFFLFSLLGVILTLAIDDIQENFSYDFIGFTAGFMWQYRPLYSTFIELLLVMLSPVSAFSTGLIVGSSLKRNLGDYLCERELDNAFKKINLEFFILIIPFSFAIFTFPVGILLKIFGILAAVGYIAFIPVLNLISKKISLSSSQFDVHNASLWKVIMFIILGFCASIFIGGIYS
ncbi:hypothetical protein SteCoe_9582 [Stentor coeruleus]|uniref:Amino acid transporter transmembrane domain-containing protein n=1 Tax=Stentor coeruleus TaxID=5963 RepID=A0A1R2CHM1_9CILI|nr:hypothetical protein SteCoe_9582 [Stentor coeruleus]